MQSLLTLLADGKFHSGEQIGRVLGVSRAAIWKSIKELESLGVGIDAVTGRGYRLRQAVELLDEAQILQAIQPAVGASIRALEVHFSIDSTNRYLASEARNGMGEAHVCLAEMQTAGRGRRGRTWCSPLGANLYLSVAWGFAEGPARLSGLSLALAVACAEALAGVGISGIQLKWPNDIWLDYRKVAGLLLEVSGEANGPCQVIAGVGVNLGMPRDTVIDQPWADLCEASSSLSRNHVAAALVEAMVKALKVFASEGFEPFRHAWVSWDAVCGRAVTLHLPNGVVEGTAAGIDPSGALLLETVKGMQRFTSGEVSLRVRDHVASA
jgi:BirA family biotin operon repressor/biotin-[acetyl-CoA-carboxylase] ligase